MLLSRFEFFGLFILMIKAVGKEFFKLTITFLFFIIAFSFSFFFLIYKSVSYKRYLHKKRPKKKIFRKIFQKFTIHLWKLWWCRLAKLAIPRFSLTRKKRIRLSTGLSLERIQLNIISHFYPLLNSMNQIVNLPTFSDTIRMATLVIFFPFMLVIVILLSNLFTGVAVDNIERILNETKIKKIAIQVRDMRHSYYSRCLDQWNVDAEYLAREDQKRSKS